MQDLALKTKMHIESQAGAKISLGKAGYVNVHHDMRQLATKMTYSLCQMIELFGKLDVVDNNTNLLLCIEIQKAKEYFRTGRSYV